MVHRWSVGQAYGTNGINGTSSWDGACCTGTCGSVQPEDTAGAAAKAHMHSGTTNSWQSTMFKL